MYFGLFLERTRLVHPHLRALTWTPPPSTTCRREYFFVSCAYVYPMHDNADTQGAVAGVGGLWRVEGGLAGAWSPFSWLGIACASRRGGSINGLCLSSWYGVEHNIHESTRVALVCKIICKRYSFEHKLKFRERELRVRAPTLSSRRTRATVCTPSFTRGG